MTLPRLRFATLLTLIAAAALLACGGGCGAPPSRLIDGRFEGRLVSVTAFDHRGNAYEVAALEVDAAPAGYAAPRRGEDVAYPEYVRRSTLTGLGGRAPLLVEGGGPTNAIDPAGLPVGRRVSVRGLMMVTSCGAPVGSGNRHAFVSRQLAVDRDVVNKPLLSREHVIVIDGPVEPHRP